MTPAIHHFINRVREALRSPRLLLAALVCGMTLAGFDALMVRHLGHSEDGTLAALFYWGIAFTVNVGGFASIIGSGATSSPGQGRSWSTRWVGAGTLDWAHPPLPLGPKSRILVEAFAAVGLMLLSRAILEPGYLLLPGVSWVDVSGFVRDRLIDACMILPCAAAWLSPSRFRTINGVRRLLIGLAVVAWSLVAARVGTWSWGVMALVLTAGLLKLTDLRPRFTMPFRGLTRAGALVRRVRTPAAQLQRDFWFGPPTVFVSVTLGVLVLLFADAILYGMPGTSVERSAVTGGAIPFFGVLLSLPLGIPLLGRQARRGGTPLFGGHFAAAWSALPVRRDVLLRVVYAHGLIWGGCVTAFLLTNLKLGFSWLLAAAGLAASLSVAGALVSVAIGDRSRGLLSMVAAVVSLGALAMPAMLTHAAPVWTTVAPIAVAALAGAAGGLPPLVHLRWRPARNG